MIQIVHYQQFIKSKGLQQEFENFLQYSPGTTMYLANKLKNMPSATQEWKKFVDETDVVENVCQYMDDAYDFFREESFFPEGDVDNVFEEKIGKLGSPEWKDFQYSVIQTLKNSGAFSSDEGDNVFQTENVRHFDDSRGCHDIVVDEAFRVLNKTLNTK